MKVYPRVLTIAGSDSGGGAGIQADLKTFAALECFGMSAITAITAQNTLGINAILPISAKMVRQQLEAVISDIGCDAIKIGMLFNDEIIEVVLDILSAMPSVPVILDPLLCAKGGFSLQKDFHSLKSLFPLSLMITPNLMEASEFLEFQISSKPQMEIAAFKLLEMGANNVLLKGGHLQEGQGSDCFCTHEGVIHWIEKPEVKTKNTHGTGCTLASAISAYLAKQYSLIDAIHKAKHFLHSALIAGADFKLGSGHGPLHHFHAFWRE